MATASGRHPDLRVSDADREAVVTELGRHFQDGRLDHGEFDERMGAALSAKTEGDLTGLLTDLPRSAQRSPADPSDPSDRHRGGPPLIALLPIALVAFAVTGLLTGGWYHGTGWHHGAGWVGAGWPFAPFGLLWLIIPILAIRARARGWRRRQYQSEGGR